MFAFQAGAGAACPNPFAATAAPDTAAAAVPTHNDFTCDGHPRCWGLPIKSASLYMCTVCPDTHFCGDCHSAHDKSHPLIMLKESDASVVRKLAACTALFATDAAVDFRDVIYASRQYEGARVQFSIDAGHRLVVRATHAPSGYDALSHVVSLRYNRDNRGLEVTTADSATTTETLPAAQRDELLAGIATLAARAVPAVPTEGFDNAILLKRVKSVALEKMHANLLQSPSSSNSTAPRLNDTFFRRVGEVAVGDRLVQAFYVRYETFILIDDAGFPVAAVQVMPQAAARSAGFALPQTSSSMMLCVRDGLSANAEESYGSPHTARGASIAHGQALFSRDGEAFAVVLTNLLHADTLSIVFRPSTSDGEVTGTGLPTNAVNTVAAGESLICDADATGRALILREAVEHHTTAAGVAEQRPVAFADERSRAVDAKAGSYYRVDVFTLTGNRAPALVRTKWVCLDVFLRDAGVVAAPATTPMFGGFGPNYFANHGLFGVPHGAPAMGVNPFLGVPAPAPAAAPAPRNIFGAPVQAPAAFNFGGGGLAPPVAAAETTRFGFGAASFGNGASSSTGFMGPASASAWRSSGSAAPSAMGAAPDLGFAAMGAAPAMGPAPAGRSFGSAAGGAAAPTAGDAFTLAAAPIRGSLSPQSAAAAHFLDTSNVARVELGAAVQGFSAGAERAGESHSALAPLLLGFSVQAGLTPAPGLEWVDVVERTTDLLRASRSRTLADALLGVRVHESNECVICLGDVEGAPDCIFLPCGHKCVHSACIDAGGGQFGNSCVLCRRAIRARLRTAAGGQVVGRETVAPPLRWGFGLGAALQPAPAAGAAQGR